MRLIVVSAPPSHPYRARLAVYGFVPRAWHWQREEPHATEDARALVAFLKELQRAGCTVGRVRT